MTNVDEIDRVWRDGLQSMAAFPSHHSDPHGRVAARVRARHRTRRIVTMLSAIAFVVIVAAGSALLLRDEPKTRVAGAPSVVVAVTDAPGGQLRIELPGRPVSGDPPHVTLPAGNIRFEIHGRSAGHVLVLDGDHGFTADFTNGPETITEDVHLEPGVYRLHCAIAGHAEAGEEMLLLVR